MGSGGAVPAGGMLGDLPIILAFRDDRVVSGTAVRRKHGGDNVGLAGPKNFSNLSQAAGSRYGAGGVITAVIGIVFVPESSTTTSAPTSSRGSSVRAACSAAFAGG